MRTIDEIKADLRKCYSGKSTADRAKMQSELLCALLDDISLDRLTEICNAERDGRCVVLPKKIGETVNTKHGIGEVVAWDTTARVKTIDEPDFTERYRDYGIGSKIFTRAEAEAAK